MLEDYCNDFSNFQNAEKSIHNKLRRALFNATLNAKCNSTYSALEDLNEIQRYHLKNVVWFCHVISFMYIKIPSKDLSQRNRFITYTAAVPKDYGNCLSLLQVLLYKVG